MTVFEFIEFVTDLLVLGCLKVMPKRKPSKQKKSSFENGTRDEKSSAPIGPDGKPDMLSANERLYNKTHHGQVLDDDFENNPYLSLKFV